MSGSSCLERELDPVKYSWYLQVSHLRVPGIVLGRGDSHLERELVVSEGTEVSHGGLVPQVVRLGTVGLALDREG